MEEHVFEPRRFTWFAFLGCRKVSDFGKRYLQLDPTRDWLAFGFDWFSYGFVIFAMTEKNKNDDEESGR